ncbi:MAG: methyltransferase domain-containing protein [Bacteroidia bacterium]|nr:methyltransferase domain-containing protein [Bacteroidia bacterium]
MKRTLNERIRHFYDQSTPLWLDTWGEHMHHGHYGDGNLLKDRHQAQIDLIQELLRWGGVSQASRVLDLGCGVGGSARYLARTFGATVTGLTLSPVQAAEAARYNAQAGLDNQVQVVVRDMMTLSADDGKVDLIWSMESAEHIQDKKRLFEICYECLSPGGTLLMATWCHRPVPPALTKREQGLLTRIFELFHLPPMVPSATLARLAQEAGFEQVETGDWSRAVSPFWLAVIRSALSWRSIRGLLRAGWSTLKGAWAMQYMQRGFRQELIEFTVLKAHKPVI